MGYEAIRETILANQKKLGIFEPGTVLSPPDPDVPAWDTLSELGSV